MSTTTPRPASQFPYRRLGAFVAAAAVLMLLVGVGANSEEISTYQRRADSSRPTAATGRDMVDELPVIGEATAATPGEPRALPDAVVVVVAALAGVGVLYLLSRQRFAITMARRRMKRIASNTTVDLDDAAEAEAIASFARDLIDELAAGDDPRLAIQAAYAAVETGFGSKELERKAAETPLKYMDRIFGKHQQVAAPLGRLTALFQHARFSRQSVDESMRTAAIAALREIRDYYQQVSWERISALPRAR